MRPGVQVEILGHLIYFFPEAIRHGTRVTTTVPSGTAVGYLPDLLNIPRHEIQAILVNGVAVRNLAATLGPGDRVVVLPIVSGG